MSGGELVVATLNLENGRELDLLPDLVAQLAGIDVLLLQEARAFDTQKLDKRPPRLFP